MTNDTTTPKPKGAAGSFDIPTHPHNSTEGARREFARFWGEDFHGNDADIRHLAAKVPSSNSLAMHAPFGTKSRCEHLLWMMRESGAGMVFVPAARHPLEWKPGAEPLTWVAEVFPLAVYTIAQTPGAVGDVVFELRVSTGFAHQVEQLGNEYTFEAAQARAEQHRAGPSEPVWSPTLGGWRLR